ncbi:phosphotransferase family protein [Flavisphingomonas formosensis]|uniref:phosphotransferase family protein n=1 Tax=Flavisphingomonas formosensis TaxID=861534 RepID=UPI0012FA2E55|nr:phosphotransferase family protein [Sphingomonas formosensis]
MIELEALQDYFAGHMGSDVRVTRFRRTFPGISRETFLVWTEEKGAEGGYVFRTDALGGPICPVPLEYEYRIIKGLHATAVPVAEPLWFDAAPAIAEGRPVMVRRMVDGSNDIPGLYDEGAEAAARRQRVALEHAEKLATLHSLDLDATGFSDFVDIPASAAECARADYDRWMRIFREVRTDPFPLVTEAAFWLEEHLPTSAPRISLCKGNNGMGEEIWKDDRIVALSDWELAFAGDPAQDWALSQGMLTLGDAETTLGHYEDVAGFAIDRSSLDFYRVWEVWKAVPTLNNGLRPFLSGKNPRAPRLNLGFGRVKLFEQLLGMMIGKPMDEAAHIVAEWRKSPYRPENAAN